MNKTYTEEELRNLFKHHPPSTKQIAKYKEIRKHENLTYELISDVFSSPEKVTGGGLTYYEWPIQKVTLSYAWAINDLCPSDIGSAYEAIDCVLMVKHALMEHVYQRTQEEPGGNLIQGIGSKQHHLTRIAVENCFKARVMACRSIALAGVDPGDDP